MTVNTHPLDFYIEAKFSDLLAHPQKKTLFKPLSFSGEFESAKVDPQTLNDRVTYLQSDSHNFSALDRVIILKSRVTTSETEKKVAWIYNGNIDALQKIFPGMTGNRAIAISYVLCEKDAEKIAHALIEQPMTTLQEAWATGLVHKGYLTLALDTINKAGELIANRKNSETDKVYKQLVKGITVTIMLQAQMQR